MCKSEDLKKGKVEYLEVFRRGGELKIGTKMSVCGKTVSRLG